MINQFASYFRLLSLDVVLGVCVSTLFVAKYVGVDLPIMVVVALGMAVWIIYTFDHLIDGSKKTSIPSTPRHQFHQRNSKRLYVCIVVMIFLGFAVVSQLPHAVIFNGLWLVLAVVLYFGGLKLIGSKPSFYKEPLVALAYAIGVFLGPVSLMNFDSYYLSLPLFTTYILLALINLMVFSVYEIDIDEKDQHTSLVRLWGLQTVNILIWVCFSLLVGLLTYQSLGGINISIVILVLMSTVLMSIHLSKDFFKNNEWYRIVGDAVFYFPVITLI